MCSLRSESTQVFESKLNEIYPTKKVNQMDEKQNFEKTRSFKKDANWTLSERRPPGSLVHQDDKYGTSQHSMKSTEQAEIHTTRTMKEASKSMPEGIERARSPREGNRGDDSKRIYHLRSRPKHYPSNQEATFQN